MNQPTLFQETGEENATLGLQRAVDRADRNVQNWSDKCWELFIEWLQSKSIGSEFMIEDFRFYIELTNKLKMKDSNGLPLSKRAFGFIPRLAVKEGLIKHVGYGKVTNQDANRANASVWRKL